MRPTRSADTGLLILRLGIGLYLVAYGLPKLLAGSERWTRLGAAMGRFGIDQWPALWGFSASLTVVCGGILFALGLLFRPICALLAWVMLVASIGLAEGSPGMLSSLLSMGHPAMMLIVFIACCFIGPGAYALDRKYRMTLTRRYEKQPLPQGVDADTR